uniref:Uncharacterized protein n=1 Tax=viral metagenome TaxID=1070528 RepID=A0A6C0JZA1_9ZZZZ
MDIFKPLINFLFPAPAYVTPTGVIVPTEWVKVTNFLGDEVWEPHVRVINSKDRTVQLISPGIRLADGWVSQLVEVKVVAG